MILGTIIIAEIGVNHNGSLDVAKQLIDEASKAGANDVKFQTFNSKSIVTSSAKQANYQIKNTGKKESQFNMLKKLELSKEMHIKLINYIRKKR